MLQSIRWLIPFVLLTAACGSVSPTISPTESPSATPVPTETLVAAATATATPRPSPTATLVPTGTPTATALPTRTLVATATGTVPPRTSPTPTRATSRFPSAPRPGDYKLALLVDGLRRPTYLTHAGDGAGRVFVVEQVGRILVVANGQLLEQPFLDISSIVRSSGSEQGLLSVAFHPRYASNGRFFVNYTDERGDIVVARYNVTLDPNVADPESAQTLLTIDQPYANHNGGQIQFGPDGYLYVGMGDGGSAGDPQGNGQNLGALLGKMLRIDVDAASPYGIPPDNPFRNRGDAKPEIWAYGVRNPWRFSFDRATGDLYMADVGQNAYEEVNFQPAASRGGENYGWNFMEGNHPYGGRSNRPEFTPPVAEYSHSEGGCSVTGGYVYRGARLPGLTGIYLFGDYCTGLTWTIYRSTPDKWERQLFLRTNLRISSFGEDEAGELYVLDHAGAVYRLEPAS
ncbi:MAG: PQQ-dependent sugar dehydrogenase [Anaerolineae bacterium]|nr:PQQ-dependent sugar dehydrogenase [Anaerolineae bacterium]